MSRPVRSQIMVWKLKQRLEPPLADLRLIRRVGRVPGGILKDVALDDGGHNRAGIALADQRGEDLIAVRDAPHVRQRIGFAERLT